MANLGMITIFIELSVSLILLIVFLDVSLFRLDKDDNPFINKVSRFVNVFLLLVGMTIITSLNDKITDLAEYPVYVFAVTASLLVYYIIILQAVVNYLKVNKQIFDISIIVSYFIFINTCLILSGKVISIIFNT